MTTQKENSLKTTFLYSAISDAQGTIRATDAKIGLLLVILAIPLTKLGQIFVKCHSLLSCQNRFIGEFGAVLTVIFASLWCLSFLAAMKAIIAIDDPSQHIDGAKPSGVFYSGGLFRPTFLDAFQNRPLIAKKQLHQQLEDFPDSVEEINKELVFEHAKLVYIRSIKMNRMKYAFIFGIAWVFCGGVLWLTNLLIHC